jgi:excisionase family DNA binding protein
VWVRLISTNEAAGKLGISPMRVRQLIRDGKLPATKIGRDYVIDPADLAGVKTYGRSGRPPKTAKS